MIMSQTDKSISGATSIPNRRGRDLVILIGLFVLMLVGLIGVAAATGWEETKAQLAKLSLGQVGILLLFSLANYGLRGLRWHLFAKTIGIPLSLKTNTIHFCAGFAMTVTPGRIGELVRMRWIRRMAGWPFERTAPLVLADRASDMAAMAILLAVAVPLSTTGVDGALPVAVLALALAIISTRPTVLSWLTTKTYSLLGFWPRLFARIRAAARSMRIFSNPSIMIGALLLGILGWAAEGYAFYILLFWMGADISIWAAILIFAFSTLAGTVTGSPGGIGGAEAAMIGLLSLQGIPLEMSIPATAVIRITTLWFAIGIGLILFPIAEGQ